MKILFLAAEATPWVKIGGLADVAGELPRALHEAGMELRLALPYYPQIKKFSFDTPPELVAENVTSPDFSIPPLDVYRVGHQGLEVWLVDGPPMQTPGPVYGNLELEANRYQFFSLAALQACQALDWMPDVVHAHDWHTALSVVWLAQQGRNSEFWRSTRSVLTVHNLPYMGPHMGPRLGEMQIEPVNRALLPDWARDMPLPMGIASADFLTTVSPTYAKEIQTQEFGRGMEALLSARSQELFGIVNGIDDQIWNPATDPAIAQTYDRHCLEKRAANKAALVQECGLTGDPTRPLLGMITRMDYQKGVELAVTALRTSVDSEWAAIFLGTGDPELEAMVGALATEFPGRVAAIMRFDQDLARRMYAGLDMILIPSRYEPCGLAQLIGMRYGCIPVVRATGGLMDTVDPYIPPERGTGFRFEAISAGALAGILDMAITTFQQKETWRQMQVRAMSQDFSWQQSASRYRSLYHDLLNHPLDGGQAA
jgi:starch synthase